MPTGFDDEEFSLLDSTLNDEGPLQDMLGLLPARVDELESVALPTMRAALRRPPANNDVLSELCDAANALRSAEKAIVQLLRASIPHGAESTDVSPREAAAVRVMLATYKAEENPEVLERTLLPMAAALRVIDKAISGLPSTPMRRRTASPYSVALIDRALISGFFKAHGHWPGTDGQVSDKPIPAYPVETSYAEGSDFRRIVEICFEATGAKPQSRERAIRQFMLHERS